MSSGTLTRKRILRSLEERYAAGKLNVNALDKNGLSLVHQFSYDGQLAGLQWALQHEGDLLARYVLLIRATKDSPFKPGHV